MGITERLRSHIQADFWLLFATLIWGTSFPLVKIALRDVSPLLFLTIRFSLGAIFIIPFLLPRRLSLTSDRLKRGAILGLFMFLGMMFQTLGLQYTTASKSGFLTGLCVVFVPFLVIFIEKRFPRTESLIGVILAVLGIYFLTDPRGGGFNKGDFFTLLCAVSFAFQILFVELLVKENESTLLTLIMVSLTAILAGFSSLLFETPQFHFTLRMLGSLIFVASFCTTLGFQIQIHWQPRTNATAAAVIFTMEPVFATLFALLILNEHLGAFAWVGAALIVSGMILTEFRK